MTPFCTFQTAFFPWVDITNICIQGRIQTVDSCPSLQHLYVPSNLGTLCFFFPPGLRQFNTAEPFPLFFQGLSNESGITVRPLGVVACRFIASICIPTEFYSGTYRNVYMWALCGGHGTLCPRKKEAQAHTHRHAQTASTVKALFVRCFYLKCISSTMKRAMIGKVGLDFTVSNCKDLHEHRALLKQK